MCIRDRGETTSEKLGVTIRRFPVRKRNTAKFDEINGYLIQGKIISPEQEKVFLEEMVNSSQLYKYCLLYTSPSPRDRTRSRMPSSA